MFKRSLLVFTKLKTGLRLKAPKILTAAGLLLLLSAGALEAYVLIDDYLAGSRARIVLEQMLETLPYDPAHEPAINTVGIETGQDNVKPEPAALIHPTPKPAVSAPVTTVNLERSYDTAGILNIPQLGLVLPVLSEYTSDLLKVSICIYETDTGEKPQRTVIAGHNYNSHFGKLPKLRLGDEIFFTTLDGKSYRYTVSEITDISMYDHEVLEAGEWDITLFTCDTSDPSRRVLVRCIEN